MAGARRRLRVVLLQVRGQRDAEEQELRCFRERCELAAGELDCVNLVPHPRLSWARVADADALLIGGAGAHSVLEDYPFTPYLDDVMARWIEESRPLFGSCWGHQLLARVLGGVVARDKASEEVGTYDIELTAAGREDPLLAGFPPVFPAHLGHHDHVASAPGIVELARSARCPYQLLRLVGKPVYGSQFHSEMDRPSMHERLLMYQGEYLDTEEGRHALASLRPTPHAERLLRRFLEVCVLGS